MYLSVYLSIFIYTICFVYNVSSTILAFCYTQTLSLNVFILRRGHFLPARTSKTLSKNIFSLWFQKKKATFILEKDTFLLHKKCVCVGGGDTYPTGALAWWFKFIAKKLKSFLFSPPPPPPQLIMTGTPKHCLNANLVPRVFAPQEQIPWVRGCLNASISNTYLKSVRSDSKPLFCGLSNLNL